LNEQQPTVAHTFELSLPIKLLPGEDDVKLREGKSFLFLFESYLINNFDFRLDITYCTHNRSVPFRGELIATKYRLLFVKKPPEPIQVLVDVPLGMISQIEKVGGQTRSNMTEGAAYGIEIHCKVNSNLYLFSES